MVKKRNVFLISLCLFTGFSFGQSFSIRQCIDYAMSNNENQKIAVYELALAKEKIREQVGTMLPQIDGSVSYVDNLKLQKSVLPGAMIGSPNDIIIAIGTQYNGGAGIQLTQKIFDPVFSVALKAAKANREYYEQSQQKTWEQTAYKVCSAYYQCLILAKQYSKLEATLASSEKLLFTTELKFKNGMASKIDVDKIRVSYNITHSQLEQSELNYKQSLNSLKFQMGMSMETSIVLTDTASIDIDIKEALAVINSQLDLSVTIDYQLQKTNLKLQELQKRQNVMSYLPSLNFSAAYNYNAIRQEFNLFDRELPWYNSYNVGFSLKVPIFDGFQKQSKIAQSKLNILVAQQNVNITEQSIKLNVANYETQYKNAIDNIRTEKENFDLAQNLYANSQLQYKEGLGNALDVVQTENSMRESQNNYFNKLFSLFIARLDLEQSKGTLMNYINNFK